MGRVTFSSGTMGGGKKRANPEANPDETSTRDNGSGAKRRRVSGRSQGDRDVDGRFGEGGGDKEHEFSRQGTEHDDDEDGPGETMNSSMKGEEDYSNKFSISAGDMTTETIGIEPFNLREEREGGDGAFDLSGNYVWRKRGKGGDEEEDAWLDGLEEGVAVEDNARRTGDNDDDKHGGVKKGDQKQEQSLQEEKEDEEMTEKNKSFLYSVLLTYLSQNETVASSLRRLGKLVKSTKSDEGANKLARDNFDQVTEAADALLQGGDTEVYQRKREVFEQNVKEINASASSGGGYFGGSGTGNGNGNGTGGNEEGSTNSTELEDDVKWEYRGQDGALHGPVTSAQMLQWRSQGYFTGESAVDIRRWVEGRVAADKTSLNNKEDLMNDLDDSDEEEGGESGGADPPDAEENEWRRSDGINFAAFL